MNEIPIYSDDISLYDEPDEGLKIECSENYSHHLKKYLVAAGFKCGRDQLQIAGTTNIHNRIEFGVLGGDFTAMKQVIANGLLGAGITIHEESFSSVDDVHIRLNLTNVSVFNK